MPKTSIDPSAQKGERMEILAISARCANVSEVVFSTCSPARPRCVAWRRQWRGLGSNLGLGKLEKWDHPRLPRDFLFHYSTEGSFTSRALESSILLP
jgi:hypothetical protein